MTFAWATAQEGKAAHWQALPLHKVRRAVIGTQFAQTEPWVLSELDKVPNRLRVMIDAHGVFHPKVLIGRRGDAMKAIIGSANFTTSAFTSNTEVCVLLEGQASDNQFTLLKTFVDKQFEDGKLLDPAWLIDYSKAWEAEKKRKIILPGAKLEITSVSSLAMSWPDYVALIRAQNRTLKSGYKLRIEGPSPSYFSELDQADFIFATGKPFADLERQQRGMLLGLQPDSCGLLGTMRAAGYAKQVVYQFPEQIGAALDHIPTRGPVSLTLVASVFDQMMAIKGVKIGVASRLLAVKRPDLFVSVNNGSNPQLAKLIGGKLIRKTADYIHLLNIVWSTDWHKAPAPTDAGEAMLWRRRAALLDAALYEEVKREAR